MPLKRLKEEARRLRRRGLAPATQAGVFVREEIRRIRHGEHGARSPEQAIAIGLSEARRAGVSLPPRPGTPGETSRHRGSPRHPAATRRRKRRAELAALRREPVTSASPEALSLHARRAAAGRTAAERRESALAGASHRSPARRRHRREVEKNARSSFSVVVDGAIVRDDFLTLAGATRYAARRGGHVLPEPARRRSRSGSARRP